LGVGRWALGVGGWALGVGGWASGVGANRTTDARRGRVVHFLTLTGEKRTLVSPVPRERAIWHATRRCAAVLS
jgi:hypothetical protein